MKNKNLLSLSLGTITSSFASSILWVILPLYMWDVGFTLFDMGIMYAAQSLIMVLFSRFFGILADASSRKKYIVAGDITVVLAYAIITSYILLYNHLSFIILILFSIVLGFGWSLGSGAFAAAITTVLSRTYTEKATGVYLSADAIGWTVGSFISGFLIDTLGIIPVLFTALLSSLIGLLVIVVGYSEAHELRKCSLRNALLDAWKLEVRGDRNLLLVFLLAIFLSLGASIYFLVFIIKFYIIIGSKSLYGFISGLAGLFGILAPYLAGALGDKRIKEILLGALTIRVAFMFYLSFSWDLYISILFWLIPLWGIINVALISQTTRFSWEGYESEAHAIRNLLMQVAMTIGNILGAVLVDIFRVDYNISNMWIVLLIGALIYGLGIPIALMIKNK